MPDATIAAHEVDYSQNYMDEFYGELTDENRLIGDFLSDASAALPKRHNRLLDVACGPSMLYWLFFHHSVENFVGLDYSLVNTNFVKAEANAILTGSCDPRYAEVCAHVVQRRGLPTTPERYQTFMLRGLEELIAHDLGKSWPLGDESFDLVVSCFGIDHVETREQFLSALLEARRVLSAAGRLILVTLCETDSWRSGEYVAGCLYTTEESLRCDLASTGFRVLTTTVHPAVTAIDRNQGYEKILFCQAEKIL